MSKATIVRDAGFREFLEAERLKPVQRNLFTGELETLRVEVPESIPEDETVVDEGISIVRTDDIAQLVISGFGLYLGKKSERLIVRKDKTVLYQFPFFRIQEVVVASKGISLSSDLLEELCVRGIRINFWGSAGKPYALLSSPYLNATIQTRRDQLAAFNDVRGFEFSRAVVEGKVRNQKKLIRYFGKYLKKTDPQRFDRINGIADSLASQTKKVKGLTARRESWHCDSNREWSARQELPRSYCGTCAGPVGIGGAARWEGVPDPLHHTNASAKISVIPAR